MSAARARPHRSAVLVSGSGSNLQALIDQIAAGRLATQIIAVISDRPGVPALERARRAAIPAITIDYGGFGDRAAFCQALADELAALAPDLVVLAGFMRILTPPAVQPFNGRMLNVHPSLLPKYPGLHTYRRALEANDAWHGSTVHFVTPELDAGPALIQYRVAIRRDDTESSLRSRVQQGEHLIYPRAVDWLATGRAQLRDDRVWLDGQPLEGPVIVDE
jgi:phosphoribosylglycinamide formyltransferase-1